MAFSISKWIFKICLLVVLANPKNFASADSSITSFLRGSQESKSLEDLDIPEDPQEDAVTDDLAAREERELAPYYWTHNGYIATPYAGSYAGGYGAFYNDPYYYPSNYLRASYGYNYGPARYSYYNTASSFFGYGFGSYWPWGRNRAGYYWSF